MLRLLKMERSSEAESWGIRALGLGKEFGRKDVVKNSHYLLAEIYSTWAAGKPRTSTTKLWRTTTPNFPALKNYLHQISLMGMLNLRA